VASSHDIWRPFLGMLAAMRNKNATTATAMPVIAIVLNLSPLYWTAAPQLVLDTFLVSTISGQSPFTSASCFFELTKQFIDSTCMHRASAHGGIQGGIGAHACCSEIGGASRLGDLGGEAG
jgi:hypothetical protein